jgi:hypothetical protein
VVDVNGTKIFAWIFVSKLVKKNGGVDAAGIGDKYAVIARKSWIAASEYLLAMTKSQGIPA